MSLDEARLLANVQHRAKRLFQDGYQARLLDNARVKIISPNGRIYTVMIGEEIPSSCTCPFFVKHEGKHACKHLLGVCQLLAEQAERQSHNATMWEATT
jgi:predicted nucleic acid-binding Zn finger protein